MSNGTDGPSGAGLSGETVAILGYGEDARKQASELRRAGNHVSVAVRPGGLSWIRATSDGFRPKPVQDAVENANVVVVHVPEAELPSLFSTAIGPHLKKGALLVFGHAGAIQTKAIVPDAGLDVVLVTKKPPAKGEPLDKSGCLVAVHQDATGQACERAIAYARSAMHDVAGSLGTTTFAKETETELAELVDKLGGVGALLAEWDRVLASSGPEPDEATLKYYERLRQLVSDNPGIRIPPPPRSLPSATEGDL